MSLADSTYAQLRSELGSTPSGNGRPQPGTDWLGVLTLVHESVWGGDLLRRTHPARDPLPWPQVADELTDLGRVTADGLRAVGASVDGSATAAPTASRQRGLERDTDVRRRLGDDPTSDRGALLRAADLYGWLSGLQADAARARSSAVAAS